MEGERKESHEKSYTTKLALQAIHTLGQAFECGARPRKVGSQEPETGEPSPRPECMGCGYGGGKVNADRNTELTQIVHDFAVRLSDEGIAPDNQILTDHADCSTCQWVFYHKNEALEALDYFAGCGYEVRVSDDRKVYLPVPTTDPKPFWLIFVGVRPEEASAYIDDMEVA